MADSGQQIVMLDPGTTLIENGGIVTVANTNEVDQDVNEDILKQALEEASKDFVENEVEYSGETVQVIADSNGQLTEANTVVGEDGTTYTLVPAGDGSNTVHAVPHTVQTLDEQPLLQLQDSKTVVDSSVTTDETVTVTTVSDAMTGQPVTIENDIDEDSTEYITQDEVSQHVAIQPMENSTQIVTGAEQGQSNTRTVTVVTTNANGEPLGTSTNPIRIIQQGNQYTSMQQLSAEQLAQIMQVVQQQQLARNSAGGSTVLFNPQTQTRIVYKVIYPSELHGNKVLIPGGTKKNAANGPRQITVPKSMVTLGSFGRRQYKKRNREEEEKVDGPELTKEEKEERKKHRPRTRSGRVSKPPKHMVKDYKHIHHLDWDEDYDDSDGGYSDFRMSEGDEEEEDDDGDSVDRGDKPYINAGLLSTKPKEYKCDKCPKAYIGKAGLARHYRLNQDHGDAEELMEGKPFSLDGDKNGIDGSLTDESTQDSIGSASNQSQQTVTSTSSPSSSQPTQPVDSTPTTITTTTTESDAMSSTSTTPMVSRPVRAGPGRPRGSRSRHHFYYGETNAQRRKLKLRELMKQCTNEDLMEVVLPRLARVITLWEFLMMKVEKGRPAKPRIQDVCSEFEELHKHVKKMCQDHLQPISGQSLLSGPKCQLKEDAVARSLGFSAGTFAVKEKRPLEELLNQPVRFKVVNSDANIVHKIAQPVKRVALSPEQPIAPKKQRILLARDDSQNRTMVLHTNSTSPIQAVPGRSLLKSSPNIVMGSNNSVVISSPQVQSTVSSNSGMMQPSPITATGQYSIIKVGQQGSSSVAETIRQPQPIAVNSQSQIIQTSLGQTVVIAPKTEDEAKEEMIIVPETKIGQQETEMQQLNYSEQEAAAESENLNGHFDAVEQNTQESVEPDGVIDSAQNGNEIQEHQIIENGEESHVYLQTAADDQNDEVQQQEDDASQENQLVVAEGDTTTQILLQQGEDGEHQIIEGANIFQTEDGLILIQNPDGTFQIHGNSDQPIPLETVQALLAMDGQIQEGQQILQVQEQEQMQTDGQEQMQVQEHLYVQEQEACELGAEQFQELQNVDKTEAPS